MTESTDPRTVSEPPLRPGGGGSAAFEDERTPQDRILVGLSKIGTAIRSSAWTAAAPHRLNPTQGQILALLLRRPAGSGLTELAVQLGVKQPTASDSVATLETKGLVSKSPDPDDARRLLVTLTNEGRSLAGRLSTWPPELVETVDTLDAREQADLLRSLVTVVRAMADSGQIGPARACATCRYFEPDANADDDRPHYCHFAQASFGDLNLRLDCLDHEAPEVETP